ncbi:MAG: hypothetical protein U9N85_01230 [Bacteroidota bacterium]|nr:hypothetical protein [Bacteroidota bacterium]
MKKAILKYNKSTIRHDFSAGETFTVIRQWTDYSNIEFALLKNSRNHGLIIETKSISYVTNKRTK